MTNFPPAKEDLFGNISMTREQRLEQIKSCQTWDIIIIGGGIVGAGILKRASQLGLKVLLLEQKDFAWGSSSRSSKMVHGGLRYIAQGKVRLTRESVQEREKMLKQAPLLVHKQSFAMSHYKNEFPWPWLFNTLLSIYDAIADFSLAFKQHSFFAKADYLFLVPGAKEKALLGGTQFCDALTDDARLVQRLIQESLQLGAQAINYCQVEKLTEQVKTEKKQTITGVQVKTEEGNESFSLTAKVVINATGAWTNELLEKLALAKNMAQTAAPAPFKMRPLRGSHLLIPSWRLPVGTVISILHPVDKRPVQIYPWQNVTLVGTTDVEHLEPLAKEAQISSQEVSYLLQAIDSQFPQADITYKDILSTFAGVRPVVASGGYVAPSKEKREHSIAQQAGLITVAGGKLTTFDIIAKQVLTKACDALEIAKPSFISSVFEPYSSSRFNVLPKFIQEQIQGCYGNLSEEFSQQMKASLLNKISYSKHLWAELVWAAKYEQIQHLDDLLLRRTRLGNVLPNGAADHLVDIKDICAKELGWSEKKWQQEVCRYQTLWLQCYSLPEACKL
jgi:glycerol-3-phosphate dehydrogenase